VASTANVTIATGLNAGDSIDGVTLAAGDRVLLKNQSTGAENGVYVAGATPARAFDMLEGVAAYGAVIYVVAGTANGGHTFANTNTTVPTIDTTALTFTDFIAKSVLTTQDDIIVRDGTGPARLAKGSDGQVLTVDPTTHHLVWATPTSGGISGIGVKEGGSTIVASATALDFGNGLDVSSPGGGVAGVVIDASELPLDTLGAPTDITTLNASTSAHGLLRKLSGSTTDYLRADGAFADPSVAPSGGSAFFAPAYGDGHEGNVTISVDTTITKDMMYNDLTVNTGINLDTACLRVFVKGTLTLNGTIRCNGNNGGNGGTGTGAAGGAAGAAGTQQTGGAVQNLPNGPAGRAGAIGGFNSNGSGTTNGQDTTYGLPNVPAGTAGGISGNGRSGGAGGGVGTATDTIQEHPLVWPAIISWRRLDGTAINMSVVNGTAAQAGSGGGAAASGGGGSGGGGSGGAVVVVCARTITGNGTIQAKGGNGGNGGNGLATAQAGGGAAGNGGQGGVVVLIYADNTGWTGTLDVSGGTKGTKGNAGGGAGSTDGGVGSDGGAGKSYTMRIA
jgi:hypothetical protein